MELVKGDPKADFWEQNPALRFLSDLKDVQNTKSSSKIMWAVYLIEDPDSPFYKIPREDRISEVQANYYNLDIKKYNYLLNAYSRLCLTKEEAMFKIHMDSMDQLTSHLKSLDIGEDKDFNKMIKVMEKLPKIWEGLEKIKTKMIDKKNKTALRGGAKQSAREKRK